MTSAATFEDAVMSILLEMKMYSQQRILEDQEGESFPTFAPTTPADDGADLVTSNDTTIILETLRIYGSLYALMFFVFCFVRQKYPKLYNTISSVFLWFSFVVCGSGYRYNFIHNHKTSPDSGGKIWEGFIQVVYASMFIGQLTLMGLLGLKETFYAVPALAPTLVITALYLGLVHPKKLRVASNLPAVDCVELDRRYAQEYGNVALDFQGKYLQPALRHRQLFPEEDLEVRGDGEAET